MPEMIDIVAPEMVGMSFKVLSTQANGLVKANTVVVVTDWNGTSPDATVMLKSVSRNVPKAELEPDQSPVSGVRL